MKHITLFTLFIGLATLSFGSTSLLNMVPERIASYEVTQENTVTLRTDFGKELIINQEDLKTLEGQTIHHIELVYTAFRTVDDFDQEELNQERIDQLNNLLPQLNSNEPTWKLVEQTGAVTASEARSYFHGFVIHYGASLEYQDLSTFFSDVQDSFTEFDVDNAQGGDFAYKSGSIIHMPADAVTHMDGSAVEGKYNLTYREFRDPADIVHSGIPMTYNKGGEDLNFSSVGMYEVRANQNGKELKLQKPIVVDFNCTEQKDGVSFYAMDDETGEWEERHPIEFKGIRPAGAPAFVGGNAPIVAQGQDLQFVTAQPLWTRHWMGSRSLRMDIDTTGDDAFVEMNRLGWKSFSRLQKKDSTLFEDMILSRNDDEKELHVSKESAINFNWTVMHPWTNGVMAPKGGLIIGGQGDNINATLLAEGADAGHTYPNMVKGLNSPDFGVYNCDQVYRIGQAVSFSPTYVEEGTGNVITKQHVTCVLDLSYNGSFSFHPNMVTMNAQGKNVILLFTKDKQVYMMDQEGFAALDKGKRNGQFTMRNVTSEIKTTSDLKKVLGI